MGGIVKKRKQWLEKPRDGIQEKSNHLPVTGTQRSVCRVGGAGGGRGAVSMIKKVEMEAAVRSWKALDTTFGTCT